MGSDISTQGDVLSVPVYQLNEKRQTAFPGAMQYAVVSSDRS
jgi:hypothetical protein